MKIAGKGFDSKAREKELKKDIGERKKFFKQLEESEQNVRKTAGMLSIALKELNKIYAQDGRGALDIEDVLFHFVVSQEKLNADYIAMRNEIKEKNNREDEDSSER